MMPTVDRPVRPTNLRVAAFLSTITLFALAGCGGTGDTIEAGPPPTAPSDGPNTAPSITGSPSTSANPGHAYAFTPRATDPNGDDITFSIQNRPSWASFDAVTGRLTGTPTAAHVGSYANIVISVSDGVARTNLPTFSITVNQAGAGSATLTWVAPTQRTDGTALTDLSGYRVYYGSSPGELTASQSVNNAGITTFVVDNLFNGTWYFAVSAVDSTGRESALSNSGSKTIS